jgi:hypothetical protein
MTEKPENPHAVPQSKYLPESLSGMTLRDYFAGQALAGISANPEFADHLWDLTAKNAFAAADAMLAERESRKP